MIISHKLKIVFIHIPKNGGSYITDLMYKIDKDCDNILVDGNEHLSFFKIAKLDIYEKIKNYTFFAIIRDPISSFISFYYYAKTNSLHYLNELLNSNCNNIEHFLKYHILSTENHFMGNLYYIYQDETFENVNNNIILLNYNNIYYEFIKFINTINQNNIRNIIDNVIINKTIYDANKKEYEIIKNIFLTNNKFKKEIDFYNEFMNINGYDY